MSCIIMLYQDPNQYEAESYFKDINNLLTVMFGTAVTGLALHSGFDWAGLFVFFLLSYSKGSEYRKVVKSYLRPHKNWKVFYLMFTKILPFTVGVALISAVAVELITFSNGIFTFG